MRRSVRRQRGSARCTGPSGAHAWACVRCVCVCVCLRLDVASSGHAHGPAAMRTRSPTRPQVGAARRRRRAAAAGCQPGGRAHGAANTQVRGSGGRRLSLPRGCARRLWAVPLARTHPCGTCVTGLPLATRAAGRAARHRMLTPCFCFDPQLAPQFTPHSLYFSTFTFCIVNSCNIFSLFFKSANSVRKFSLAFFLC